MSSFIISERIAATIETRVSAIDPSHASQARSELVAEARSIDAWSIDAVEPFAIAVGTAMALCPTTDLARWVYCELRDCHLAELALRQYRVTDSVLEKLRRARYTRGPVELAAEKLAGGGVAVRPARAHETGEPVTLAQLLGTAAQRYLDQQYPAFFSAVIFD